MSESVVEARPPYQASFTGRGAALALIVASAIARIATLLRYRVDSDEVQHLHVAWGWSRGLLPYRDVFDNHSPLFHLLTSPLFLVAAERPDVVMLGRIVMLPLVVALIFTTHRIASRAFSPVVGVWSAIAVTVAPILFSRTVEYRTDTLWLAVWMVALAALTAGKPTDRRMFEAGLLFGTAMSVSMKTTLLLIAVVPAAIGTAAIVGFRPRRLGRGVAAGLAGLAIVPAILVAYFASRGALADLVYCVVTYNARYVHPRMLAIVWRWVMPFAIVLFWLLARRMAGAVERPAQRAVRTFLLLFVVLYVSILLAFWPIISDRDFLPVLPPMIILGFGWLLERRTADARKVAAVATITAAFCIFALAHARRDDMHVTTETLARVLSITDPNDYLFDHKGDTVFRQRPYHYIFERLGRAYFASGELKDRGPEAAIRNRCYVAEYDLRYFPRRTAEFLRRYFVGDGLIRVAGSRVGGLGTFDLAIPGDYVIVTPRGHATGEIDSQIVRNFVYLSAGRHVLHLQGKQTPAAVIWRKAADRGFSPFTSPPLQQ